MPSYDKQNRPLMPILSASAIKTANRSPLTPRVAGLTSSTTSSPLSRRGARLDDNGTTSAGPSREDLSNPVSTFLSHNITPRSGSRRSRVDITHTTPTATPNGTPIAPFNEFPRLAGDTYGSILGVGEADKDMPQRHTVTFNPAIADGGGAKTPGSGTADSKFFFASDAKSPPKSQSHTKNTPSFFYANGDSIPQPNQSSTTSAVESTVGEERSQSKFFHANRAPELQASPHFAPPRPSSTVSTTSRMTSPRPAGSPGTLSPPQRPLSPQKPSQLASTSSLRSLPSIPTPLAARPQPHGRGQSTNSVLAARKASAENGERGFMHARSASVDSPESKVGQRVSSGSSFETINSSPPMPPLDLITTTLPVSTPEEMQEPGPSITGDSSSELQSPIKSGHSIEHMNELAASARQDRRVLDLEIRTSSLAAINRTLEREMRKQAAELRRYRRLSRSGRLSIATSVSVRNVSGDLSIKDEVSDSALSDASEDASETESASDSSKSESSDHGSLSPGAMAESDLRHMKKDEKRLLLDLTKHQQLLIDSQKMNQSLKRCLGWTEELINEGRKALEYHVKVSDVKLGGRILIPDDVDGDDEGVESLAQVEKRTLMVATLAAANGIATWSSANGEGGERDSGIELDPDTNRERFDGLTQTTPPPLSSDR